MDKGLEAREIPPPIGPAVAAGMGTTPEILAGTVVIAAKGDGVIGQKIKLRFLIPAILLVNILPDVKNLVDVV